jgi:hypothetical protein
MSDAVAQACATVRAEAIAISRACIAAGQPSLAGAFILDATPLHAVKRRLAELGTAQPQPAAQSNDGDIAAAIKQSGRPWV